MYVTYIGLDTKIKQNNNVRFEADEFLHQNILNEFVLNYMNFFMAIDQTLSGLGVAELCSDCPQPNSEN